MIGSGAEERGERSDGVEGRVLAIIVEMDLLVAECFCFGICVEFVDLFIYVFGSRRDPFE